jgi:predicted amidohydrolase
VRTSTPKIIRIGAYQGPTEAAAVEKNGAEALRLLGEAHARGCHFACLPECFLSGYGSPDEIRAGAINVRGEWFIDWLRNTKRFGDMVSIVGLFEKRGARIHNSAAIIHRGKIVGIYRKSMPGSAHEKKVMTCVSHFPVFKRHGVTFGVIICIEGSSPEPCMLLASKGARIIFEPHYAFPPPHLMDAQRVRIRNCRIARAVENHCWHVRANVITAPDLKIAGEAGVGYGDSLIIDPLGVVRAEAGLLKQGWITVDVPKKDLTDTRPKRVRYVPKATRKQIVKLYARA